MCASARSAHKKQKSHSKGFPLPPQLLKPSQRGHKLKYESLMSHVAKKMLFTSSLFAGFDS